MHRLSEKGGEATGRTRYGESTSCDLVEEATEGISRCFQVGIQRCSTLAPGNNECTR